MEVEDLRQTFRRRRGDGGGSGWPRLTRSRLRVSDSCGAAAGKRNWVEAACWSGSCISVLVVSSSRLRDIPWLRTRMSLRSVGMGSGTAEVMAAMRDSSRLVRNRNDRMADRRLPVLSGACQSSHGRGAAEGDERVEQQKTNANGTRKKVVEASVRGEARLSKSRKLLP